MRLGFLILFLLALALSPRSAQPCGLCHEDNRAAVYSHEAMQKVQADPQRLEFAVFKVAGPLSKSSAERLTLWLGKRPGVDAATVRISVPQRSMGFVWEKSYSKSDLMLDLQKQFPDLQFHAITQDKPA